MNYPKLVRALIAELRTAREEIESWRQSARDHEEWVEKQEYRRAAQAERDARSAEYERREAEDRRFAEEDRLRRLGSRLEKARSWGDDCEVDRIQRELKRGW